MQLTKQQLAEFDELGYIFLPECFPVEQVEALRAAASDVFAQHRAEVWREKDGAPRMAFACQQYSEACKLLASDERLVTPVEQLFGERCYLHQFKINAKAAFTGDVWQWHQDFPTWHKDDGMPEPRAMNIAVFLDDVMPINGPLMVVPRSHKAGALESSHDVKTTSYPLWTLDNKTVTDLVERNGIVTPTGKKGGVLMFHANIVHGSAGNITPYPRRIAYLTLSALSNAIVKPTRPDFIAHRDFTPVQKTSPKDFEEFLAREVTA
ncbi:MULTISPECIES: phytanoyl-CoA dioxygenase family protein [Herbaspirillum]|uniref:phytanoyl-CoA dioxygenase family protein n=1 Tax=Herbaspirillum TaxID=963 RepID=UPI0009821FC0|nr:MULTISPECIES: phytanoyl-CoA dioxygenase family protein [Herbaspirillum]MCI1013440.1 phytanoyl-CoA dioxygenase family protein [Herbaspirillum sp. C7C2]ONN68149.1 proline hydroxylase [Herbaspirillum sp. VT-16-41]QNB06836.1 proline hydroxylase [Herbaspirillum frisingense]UIN22961.1 phytanoyl-CoA dioxygenase family protein [Herbaspirillum frisingense]